jgi:hypothetical protein
MNMPTNNDSATGRSFRAEATGAGHPRPDHRDDASGFMPGALTQQELRDLILHWMG